MAGAALAALLGFPGQRGGVMKICRLVRPPLRSLTRAFPQRERHLLARLERLGHEVVAHELAPVGRGLAYLSYTAGFVRGIARFPRPRPDVVLADNMECALAAALIKFLYRVPFVLDFIDDYSLIAAYDGFRLRRRAIGLLERKLPKSADGVIVVDEHKRRFCRRIGVEEQRISLVPNGTDTSAFRPDLPASERLLRAAGEGHPLVVYVGRSDPYYSLDRVVDAAPEVLAAVPEARFCLIGDGSGTEFLKQRCRALGVADAVIFAGFVPSEEIPGCIAAADVCVFPLPDASAIVLCEYMACGKAVVLPGYSTERMGVRDDIVPEECVLAVGASPREMAKGVIRLLRDPDLRQAMGRRARSLVAPRYDWDHLTRLYERALFAACRRVQYLRNPALLSER